MVYGFVILHYYALDMTKECVDRLISISDLHKVHIVVVDNGSANGSGMKLKELYQNQTNVDVILNESNLGFANGNNVGYQYVRRYHPDFIIVMNNDVLIPDQSFFEGIARLYDSDKYAVLGPDIENPILHNHQNPLRAQPRSLDEVRQRVASLQRKCKYPGLFYLLSKMRSIVLRQKKTNVSENTVYQQKQENVVLHGACYIFAKEFISSRENCFNTKTFLYHEEDILFLECRRDNLKLVYSPELRVEHLEDVSTNASFKSDYAKTKKRNRWLLDSATVLLDIMNGGNHNRRK